MTRTMTFEFSNMEGGIIVPDCRVMNAASSGLEEIDKLVAWELCATSSKSHYFLRWMKYTKGDSVRRAILWKFFCEWFKYHEAVKTQKEAVAEHEEARRAGMYD